MAQRLLSLLYIWCIATMSCFAQGESINELYNQLDQAIAQSQGYAKQKDNRIANIKQSLHKQHNKQLLLNTYQQLYEEYESYQSDSAVSYLHQAIDLAKKAGMDDEYYNLRCQLALQYSKSGAFAEALSVLGSINPQALDKSGGQNYYLACSHVYGELGFSNMHIDTELSQDYFHKQDACRDTLFKILPPQSEEYLTKKEVLLTSQKKWQEALKVNDQRLARCKDGTHEYGVVAYYRYLIYRELKDNDQVTYWLLKSAICDIKNAINDQASLWILANMLSNEGDMERAYKYINFSWNASKQFSTRIRSWQISPTLGTIDHNYQQQLKKANSRLTFAIICTSLLVLVLALACWYANKQKSLATAARNELKKTNNQLEELNHKLSSANNKMQAVNDKLNESNGVKEEYIGQFLGACSHYIDKLDKLRLNINKMVKNRQYHEIFELTKSTEIKEKELDELYTNFDQVFLHLFPNFVEDLNSLLKEDYQIHLADPTKLSAMVRVFALIRLGIDDSTKIAEFLHYAVNTIYNYRAKLRNGAIGDRNEFEKKVKELGDLDR